MKQVAYTLPLLLGVVFWGNQVLTDEHGHNHEAAIEEPLLGGVLRDAPPFKSEIKIEPGSDIVKIYIYDQELKAVKYDKETLSGKLQLPTKTTKKKQNQQIDVSFKRVKEDKPIQIMRNNKLLTTITERYEAKLAGITGAHRYDLHVNLEAGGKTAKADFGVDNIH